MSEAPRLFPQRLETDAESVERDLFKLVLTIIELVRQLMEKQALRRVDRKVRRALLQTSTAMSTAELPMPMTSTFLPANGSAVR